MGELGSISPPLPGTTLLFATRLLGSAPSPSPTFQVSGDQGMQTPARPCLWLLCACLLHPALVKGDNAAGKQAGDAGALAAPSAQQRHAVAWSGWQRGGTGTYVPRNQRETPTLSTPKSHGWQRSELPRGARGETRVVVYYRCSEAELLTAGVRCLLGPFSTCMEPGGGRKRNSE